MISNSDLDKYEEFACDGDGHEKLIISKLITEIRRLRHEAEDPNFLFACGRIHRQAIISRNKQIDALLNKVKELEKQKG